MPRVLYCLFCLCVLFALPVHATLRTWPGPSPCNTTLSACLSAAAVNDIVQVQSNGPIDEDLSIFTALTLIASPGYRPVIAAGRNIDLFYGPGAGVAWSATIDGFTLLQGSVGVRAYSGDATLALRNLDLSATARPTNIQGIIGIDNFGTGHLRYEIERNRIRMNDPLGMAGIVVTSPNGGAFEGSIHDNRVESVSPAGDGGMQIVGTAASAPSVKIYSNQFSGNMPQGLVFWPGGQSKLTLVGNTFETLLTKNDGAEFVLSSVAGSTLDVQVFNNTFAGFQSAIFFNGAISGHLANNIFANNTVRAIGLQGTLTVSEDHNLYFATGTVPAVLGAGSFVADPKFRRGRADTRLDPGSPAIDAADSAGLRTLLTNTSIPEIDADGSRRFKGAGSNADIGAFESGDGALIALARAGSGGLIDNTLLNGNSGALPQLTQNQSPDSYSAPANDPGLVALAYASDHFSVTDEVDGSAPTAQSAYNVFVPAAGNGVFMHSSSAGNIAGLTTQLADSYVSAHPSRILLATHLAPMLFNHPYGLAYAAGKWAIVQSDGIGASFPSGLNFAVYAQDPSLNAFVWTAPVAAASTMLDHVLLNGEPCGRVYVTNGNGNAHPIELKYAQGRWAIVNVAGATIPAGAQFNVVVDEAATEFCRYDHVFHDGYEGL